MNNLGAWYDPTTWFSDSSTVSTDTASTGLGFTGGSDPFGFNLDAWLGGGSTTDTLIPGHSDTDAQTYRDYIARGGVMTQTGSGAQTSTDIFSGIGSFFTDLTKNLPGLVGLGLNTWQNVEQIIQQQSEAQGAQDSLVILPGTNTPVIKRVQGGNVTYHRIADLYPSLAPQVQQAQKNSWIGPALLVGALGLGAVLIFKKS